MWHKIHKTIHIQAKCNCRRKSMQENESVMVVRCELEILSLGITVRHRSASLIMRNSYPRDGIFNLHLITIKDSFNLAVLFHLEMMTNFCNAVKNFPTVEKILTYCFMPDYKNLLWLWGADWSLVMLISYPCDGTFSWHQTTIMDSFSCILFLRHLHYCINFTQNIYISCQKMFGSAPIYDTDISCPKTS